MIIYKARDEAITVANDPVAVPEGVVCSGLAVLRRLGRRNSRDGQHQTDCKHTLPDHGQLVPYGAPIMA